MIVFSDENRALSKSKGATWKDLIIAEKLVELAITTDLSSSNSPIDWAYLRQLEHEFDQYYPWVRLKGRKSGLRVIVETRPEKARIIYVAPRRFAYDDLDAIWSKFRTPRNEGG